MPREQNPSEMLRILKAKGASDTCYALIEDDQLNGRKVLVADALEIVMAHGMGTFLSCIPGQLAYFEDEDCRWILERPR